MSSFSPRELLAMDLEGVLDQIPAAILVAQADSQRIVYANARARQMTAQLERAMPPDLLEEAEIFRPDGRLYRRDEWPLVRSLTTGEDVVDEEYFQVRPDGNRLVVRCSSAPIYDGEGVIVAGMLVMRDVTEQKAQDERLRYLASLLDNTEDAIVAFDDAWFLTAWNQGAERMYGWSADELLGRHASEFARVDMSDEERSTLRRVIAEQGRWRGEVVTYCKDGTPVSVEVITVAVRGEGGAVTGYLALHRDATERKQAEEEAGRRAEQQALVAELGKQALAVDALRPLLDHAVDLVARTLDVELACVAEMPADGEEVILRAGVGWQEGFIGRRFERGRDSQAGYTLLHGEPVIAEDQANDPRFRRSALAEQHGVVSALTVMIATPAEPFGVLAALSTHRRSFSPSEVSFVQAVANVLASAVERSRANERLAEERKAERRRIARDLHDEALQDLTYALAVASSPSSADDVPVAPERLVAALKRVGEQLRGAIYDLRLGDEEQTPFRELLETLVGVHRAIAVDSEIELDVSGELPAGPLGATGIQTLRIVGEALTNARRHAGARNLRVRVWGAAGTLHAEVSDDGHGFDPPNPSLRGAGHGITGMRERAKLIHGNLDIRSAPATGTAVRLEVPLQAARARECSPRR